MAFDTALLSSISAEASSVAGIALNVFISTIVGGIVFLIVIKALSKKLHDNIGVKQTFSAVLLINILNIPIILGVALQSLSSVPLLSLAIPFLPLIVWVVVLKLVFSQISFSHTFLIAVIGYILSIFVIPNLVWSVRGFLPL